MRYEVLEQFFGQIVEVGILSKTHSGVLGPSEADNGSNDVVELEPMSDYYKKRFGHSILSVDAITSIKLIKPHVDEDDEDCKAECDASS